MTTDSMTTDSDTRNQTVREGIVEIFAEVLEMPGEVEAGSDFFELGGNSLLAALVVAQVRRVFGVKVTVREMFNASRPTALAELVGPRISPVPA